MVGQNLGARKYDRVKKALAAVLLIGLGFALLGTILMVKDPDAVYRVFTSDADVLSAASVLTLPLILNFYGAATRSPGFALINGSGRPKLNLTIAIIDGVIGRIGLAALLGFGLGWGCYGFWMGDAFAGFMPFIIAGIYFLSGWWKEEKRQS